MYTGRIVFSQLIDFLPRHQFDRCVRRHRGNYRTKTFTCFDQYLCMAFAQITYRQSLRDIETCLRAMQSKLYHCGIRGNVSRNTLANANENRDWRIYADFAQILINKARTLYANEDFGIQLNREVYALDSTTIDLCLSLFPWAKFRKHKAAVKVHTLMDLKGSIPTFIRITDGKIHDVNILDDLVLEPGAIYVMDRGYLDFARLFTFTKTLSTFVTRAKTNFDHRRLYYRKVDKTTGLRCDQTIRLNGFLCFTGLSCRSSTDWLFRHRDRQKVYIPNKQFYSASLDNCSTLQMPLADRNLFQMDQTISANQDVLRNFRECCEDSNLDCHQRLRSGRNRQERTRNRPEFGRNLANSQHCTFRESPYYTSTYEKCFARQKESVS